MKDNKIPDNQRVSEEDGRYHPRGQHHRVGTRVLPPQRQPLPAATTGAELHRTNGQDHRTDLHTAGLQLED